MDLAAVVGMDGARAVQHDPGAVSPLRGCENIDDRTRIVHEAMKGGSAPMADERARPAGESSGHEPAVPAQGCVPDRVDTPVDRM
jgi:hypothetical protein